MNGLENPAAFFHCPDHFPIPWLKIPFSQFLFSYLVRRCRRGSYFSVYSLYWFFKAFQMLRRVRDRSSCRLSLGVHWIHFCVWSDTGNHGNARVYRLEGKQPNPHPWLAYWVSEETDSGCCCERSVNSRSVEWGLFCNSPRRFPGVCLIFPWLQPIKEKVGN